MIVINQVKSELNWKGSKLSIQEMLDNKEVLKHKAARLLKIDEQEIRDAVANHKKVQGYTFTYDEHEK